MGRTGKKNPRLGEDFIIWADEESIIKIILNTYDYVKEYIDLDATGGKEHIGYIKMCIRDSSWAPLTVPRVFR